ncbi:TPA: hypothetical protein NBY01_005011, partial [Enterobacter hormaechei]|nr:hypothetical protein [Enterobacter hormaechei]
CDIVFSVKYFLLSTQAFDIAMSDAAKTSHEEYNFGGKMAAEQQNQLKPLDTSKN